MRDRVDREDARVARAPERRALSALERKRLANPLAGADASASAHRLAAPRRREGGARRRGEEEGGPAAGGKPAAAARRREEARGRAEPDPREARARDTRGGTRGYPPESRRPAAAAARSCPTTTRRPPLRSARRCRARARRSRCPRRRARSDAARLDRARGDARGRVASIAVRRRRRRPRCEGRREGAPACANPMAGCAAHGRGSRPAAKMPQLQRRAPGVGLVRERPSRSIPTCGRRASISASCSRTPVTSPARAEEQPCRAAARMAPERERRSPSRSRRSGVVAGRTRTPPRGLRRGSPWRRRGARARGRASTNSGQHERAIGTPREVLVRKPGDATALAELALCHLGKGERDTAQLLVKQALDVNGKSAIAHTVQASSSSGGGDDAAAFQAFSKAANEDPRDTTSRLNMGAVLSLRAPARIARPPSSTEARSPPRRTSPARRSASRPRSAASPTARMPSSWTEDGSLEKVSSQTMHSLAGNFPRPSASSTPSSLEGPRREAGAKTYFERFLEDTPRIIRPGPRPSASCAGAKSGAAAPAAPAPAPPPAAAGKTHRRGKKSNRVVVACSRS